MIDIADLSDRTTTFGTNLPHFARGQDKDRPLVIARQQSGRSTGSTGDFPALPAVHLDIVNVQAGRYRAERHGIAHFGLDLRSALDHVALGQTGGG